MGWRLGTPVGALAFHGELTTPMRRRTRLRADGVALWQAPAAVLSLGMAFLWSP